VLVQNGVGRKASVRTRFPEEQGKEQRGDASEGEEVTDGIIEDDEYEGAASSCGSGGGTGKRWKRIMRCAVGSTGLRRL
jgi:hypothetical protein